MPTHLSIGPSLGVPRIFALCRELAELPAGGTYTLDFSQTNHFEPFGMLMLVSAVRTLRSNPLTRVQIDGAGALPQPHQYAHHLGFWQAIDPTSAPATMTQPSSTTIPISSISYAAMYRDAGLRDPVRAGFVDRAATDLARVLAKHDSEVTTALAYAFREMFRNAFEHGRTDVVWYSGATRHSKDDIQVAILDEGRGIRASLADNPNHVHTSDEDALSDAVRPGVSRNAGKARSPQATERLLEQFPDQDPSLYDNFGYGLSITRLLGEEAGGFSIASGASALSWYDGTSHRKDSAHTGTAIRLVFRPSNIPGAFERAKSRATQLDSSGFRSPLLSASKLAKLGIKTKG